MALLIILGCIFLPYDSWALTLLMIFVGSLWAFQVLYVVIKDFIFDMVECYVDTFIDLKKHIFLGEK